MPLDRIDHESSQHDSAASTRAEPVVALRLRSEDLFRQGREIEIEHAGRIYRMRVTNQNKLILTA